MSNAKQIELKPSAEWKMLKGKNNKLNYIHSRFEKKSLYM